MAVKAPGWNFVPSAHPWPCSTRASRRVGTPPHASPVGLDDQVDGRVGEDLLSERLPVPEVPAHHPKAVDEMRERRLRGAAFEGERPAAMPRANEAVADVMRGDGHRRIFPRRVE